MARLVIVSNRVPVPAKKREQQAGGLAVVLEEALKGEVLWFGWSGRRMDSLITQPAIVTRGATTFATIDLSEAEYRQYYAGFANRSLWPLLHYRTGLVAYSRDEYRGYRAANRKFAEALKPLLRADDIIWVQDYHLIPLGRALREAGIGQRIGFFLHIPLPPPSVLDILPPARELIADLATYDLVGFQTEEDRDNFAGCAKRSDLRTRSLRAMPFHRQGEREPTSNRAGIPHVASQISDRNARTSSVRRDHCGSSHHAAVSPRSRSGSRCHRLLEDTRTLSVVLSSEGS